MLVSQTQRRQRSSQERQQLCWSASPATLQQPGRPPSPPPPRSAFTSRPSPAVPVLDDQRQCSVCRRNPCLGERVVRLLCANFVHAWLRRLSRQPLQRQQPLELPSMRLRQAAAPSLQPLQPRAVRDGGTGRRRPLPLGPATPGGGCPGTPHGTTTRWVPPPPSPPASRRTARHVARGNSLVSLTLWMPFRMIRWWQSGSGLQAADCFGVSQAWYRPG